MSLFTFLGFWRDKVTGLEAKRQEATGFKPVESATDILTQPFQAVYAALENGQYPLKALGGQLDGHLKWRDGVLKNLPSKEHAWVEVPTDLFPAYRGTAIELFDAGRQFGVRDQALIEMSKGPFANQQVYRSPVDPKKPYLHDVLSGVGGMRSFIDGNCRTAIARLGDASVYAVHDSAPLQVWNGITFGLPSQCNRWLDAARDADGWTYDTLGQAGFNPGKIGGEMIWSCLEMATSAPKLRVIGRFIGWNVDPRLPTVPDQWTHPLLKAGYKVWLVMNQGTGAANSGFFTDGWTGFFGPGGILGAEDNLKEICDDPRRITYVNKSNGVGVYTFLTNWKYPVTDGLDGKFLPLWASFQVNTNRLGNQPKFDPLEGKEIPFDASKLKAWPLLGTKENPIIRSRTGGL
jgi:hypothetical protein